MGILVSFDLSSDFGFFKKPDINEVGLTYNIPPKPTILGILGSILGMDGLDKQHEETLQLEKLLDILSVKDHNKRKRLIERINFDAVKIVLGSLKFAKRDRLIELLNMLNNKNGNPDFDELNKILGELKSELQYPEFYKKLKHLKIGIKPPPENFPFNKIMNKYNSRNSYYYTNENDDTANISEQLLIRPTYRIYVYDEDNKILGELVRRIQSNNPIFMPYLGKNEFVISLNNLEILSDVKPLTETPKQIHSIFLKSKNNEYKHNTKIDKKKIPGEDGTVMISGLPSGYKFVEQYPISYSDEMHYVLHMAEYTSRSDEISTADLEKGILAKVKDYTIYLF
jgi:CRISPR-associated protein Cas5h